MRYVAFFRGINVGGKNIVKMAELKKLFYGFGFQKIQTYIQSGNVVFDAEENASQVMDKIREGFLAAFGFESALMLRTAEEMTGIIDGLPFSEEEISEAETSDPAVEHLYVYLLDGTDVRERAEQLLSSYTGPDLMRIGTNEIYLLCHESVRNSKLAVLLGKLNVPMTARNWKTITKLSEMITISTAANSSSPITSELFPK